MNNRPFYFFPEDYKRVIKERLSGGELEHLYSLCYNALDEEVFFYLLDEYAFTEEELENSLMYLELSKNNNSYSRRNAKEYIVNKLEKMKQLKKEKKL
jgi:hypothetical protein